jgi:hypothetical protein
MTRAVLEKKVQAGFKRPEDIDSASDYLSSDGKTEYEIKKVTQNKYKTFDKSAKDIIQNQSEFTIDS